MEANKPKFQEGLQTPFTDLQLELLKLYSTNLTEEELRELKKQLARYYAEKAVKAADQTREDQGLSKTNIEDWLHGSS